MKLKYCSIGFLVCALMINRGLAQDIQFGDPKQVIQFYNQSIVEEHKTAARFNFREVKVQKLTAFRSGVGVITVPFSDKVIASFGGGFNQSNAKMLSQSMGLAGITIKQKIAKSNTSIALGFQGVYNQNNLNFSSATFQDQYNIYGPLPGVSTADPLAVNASYHWLSINAGLSFSHQSDVLKWFIGGSIRHINKPAVSFSKSSFFELAPTTGVQMGASFKGEQTWLGVVAYQQSKSEATETVLGFTLDRLLGQQASSSIGGALYYRFKDAVMPQVSIKFGTTRISFLYELPVQVSVRSINQKTGMELSLLKQF